MDILADENVDLPVVEWLRREGYDVEFMAESAPGMDDARVLQRAFLQKCILITQDPDFGKLIFRGRQPSFGVPLLRLRAKSAAELLAAFQSIWPKVAPHVAGHFVVASARKIRIRQLRY